MSTLVITKEDLIKLLESRLAAAKAYDEKQMKAHRAREAAALKEFRDSCRAAIKWDYATAKEKYFRPVPSQYGPECPTMMAAHIERTLARLRYDIRKKFTLSDNGRDRTLYRLATWDPTLPSLEGC